MRPISTPMRHSYTMRRGAGTHASCADRDRRIEQVVRRRAKFRRPRRAREGEARRLGRTGGRLRVRQDDAAQEHQPADRARQRRSADRGRTGRPRGRAGAASAHRLRVPRHRPVSAHERRREHRHHAAAAGLVAARDRRAHRRAARPRRPAAKLCVAIPRRALRRRAPARRRCPRHRRAAEDRADGRAVWRARSDHPRRARLRLSGAPRKARLDHHYGNPRRAGSRAARRRDRGDEARPRAGAGYSPRAARGRGAPRCPSADGDAQAPGRAHPRGHRRRRAAMNERIAQAFSLLPNYLAQHVLLSAAALALGIALSLPLAVLASRYARIRWPILAAASLVQTIPGLALLALFYPLLLGLSALTKTLVGVGVPARGFLPRVEAPLAAPMVMAGVRTAAVWTIGAATLSTAVGQTSLGNFIFSGLQTENWIFVLFGCAAAATLALAADQLLGLVEAGAARRDVRRFGLGLTGLALGTAAALLPLFAGAGKTYVIGAKNFSEQFILSELISERLEREGLSVRHKDGLGSAVAFRALASGDIDCYVDYSGTLWTNVLERRDSPPRETMLAELSRDLKQRYGVILLGALGFENAYALAMQADRAAAFKLRTIADLARESSQLKLGSDLEFLSRPEWAALRDAYGLRFPVERSFSPTFIYRALEGGEVDVISAFSSDGRIAAQKLVVLTDPKHAIPAYDAVILLSPQRAGDAALKGALEPLIGRADAGGEL